MMTLQQKLDARALVLAYLQACEEQASKDMDKEGLSDAAWLNATKVLARCRSNVIAAKTGDGWKPFHAHALEAKRKGQF